MSQEIDLIRWGLSLRSHLKVMVAIIVGAVLVAFGLAFVFMPVKYKTYAMITIPSRYFQQPVVEDIIPSSGDVSENRALREGMLKAALGRDVLESIRKKYEVFPGADKGEKEYEIAMQKFQERFEVLSLGATSFQISYIGGTSDQTFEIGKEIQQIVVEKLITLRNQKLLDLRDNLLGRVDSLAFNVEGVADPISTSRPEVIRTELSRVQGILASLKSQFSDEHPRVKAYKAREKLLKQWLAGKGHSEVNKNSIKDKDKNKIDGMSSGNMADKDRYADLLKRVDRLNIVLEYESKNPDSLVEVTTPVMRPISPVSPNYKLVFLWGLLAGMFMAMVYVSFRRISERVVTPTAQWALNQNIVYLGKIPQLRSSMAASKSESKDKNI